MSKKISKKNTKTYVLAPVNEKQMNDLVDKIVLLYKYPSREHVLGIVANRIMHAPPDQELFTIEYFAACVRKNISYQLSDCMGKANAHKIQVEDLEAELKTNPGNAQARDLLLKHASQGSPFAKTALQDLGIEEDPAAKSEQPISDVPEKAPENETLQ